MSYSCRHWNGDQMCAIKVVHSGPDLQIHEVLRVTMLPLNVSFEPRVDVIPFDLLIRPEDPTMIDKKYCKLNADIIQKILTYGLDPFYAKEVLANYLDKLGLPHAKYGNKRKRIIPLVHDGSTQLAFLQRWLGSDEYSEVFSPDVRDTMVLGHYFNDRHDSYGERVPFSKGHMKWLAAQFEIPNPRINDSMQDCLMLAAIYKNMQQAFLPNTMGKRFEPKSVSEEDLDG